MKDLFTYSLQASVERANTQLFSATVLKFKDLILYENATRPLVENSSVEVFNFNLSHVFVKGGWKRDYKLKLVDGIEESSYWVIFEFFQLIDLDLDRFHV